MALLELWDAHGRRACPLDDDGQKVVIGKKADVDLIIEDDPSVSRVHARLERVSGVWVIQDLNSTNGTYVNGERVFNTRVLRDKDEIMLGRTRLRFYAQSVSAELSTDRTGQPPLLTPKERQVLIELCRPFGRGSSFTEPASVREIAARLYVSEAAVKQHLSNLYDKFEILDDDSLPARRVRLANAALETGAVRLSDLEDPDDGET